MKHEDIHGALIRRYFLRELSEKEAQEFELRYFADQFLFEQLQAVEDDLHNDYAQNRLSLEERDRFQRYVLTTEHGQSKAEFARVMASYLKQLPSPQRSLWDRLSKPWVLWPVVVVLTATLSITVWVKLGQSNNLVKGPRDIGPAVQTDTTSPPDTEKQRGNGPADTPIVAWLKPGMVRSPQPELQTVRIGAATEIVELHLPLESWHSLRYVVSLKTITGAQVWRGFGATAANNQAVVVVRIPSNVFSTGEYILTMSGAQNSDIETEVFAFRADRAR